MTPAEKAWHREIDLRWLSVSMAMTATGSTGLTAYEWSLAPVRVDLAVIWAATGLAVLAWMWAYSRAKRAGRRKA